MLFQKNDKVGNYMIIVFLDIDGVLQPYDADYRFYSNDKDGDGDE